MLEESIDLDYTPHRYQLEVHHALSEYRFAVLVCHRRFGKTLLAVMTLLDAALRCTKPDPRFAYVAPRLKQARQIAWLYLASRARKVPHSRVNASEGYVEFPNGARITLYGASDGNEEAMRGLYMDGAVIDEVAGMKPHVWDEIMRPALSDRQGWALFIGTPHGMDYFHEVWQRAQQDPEWFTGMYRVDEVEITWWEGDPKAEIESQRERLPDASFRQEYLCDFSAAAENALITIDLVSKAASRELLEKDFFFAPKVIGVDVARFGDDRSVIMKRQGLYAWDPIVFQDVDNMTLAGHVAAEIDQWKPDAVFVDAGRGEGVIDRLRQLKFRVTEVNFGGKSVDPHFHDKRTEMWMGAKVWLEQGGCIPNDPELKTDLCGPTYEYTAAGKVRMESKDKLKERGLRSSDLGDALALTFAMPVAKHQDRLGMAQDRFKAVTA